MTKIINPHDKLFRETWQNKDIAIDFLENYLPADILSLTDLDTIEISKDSFIEDDLKDFFSDLLYKVQLGQQEGFIYILFEHKSYKDNHIHIQMLEYMIKIWRLHQKQIKTDALPIVIPLVLYHGSKRWEIDTRFSSMFSGPSEKLSNYIPDFNLIFYNLAKYSDEQIKGEILTRVVLLLFKHIFDTDIKDKLPGIIALLDDLMKEDTGLKYFEVLLRYIFSTIDNITVNDIKNIVEQSLTDVDGEKIMTLAEQLRNEGFEKGKLEGKLEGILEGIEMAIMMKFGVGSKSQKLMGQIKNITDLDQIKQIKTSIMESENLSDLFSKLTE